MKKNVLFPIETITRELDYKLLLAGMFVNKDKNIYIGQHDYLYSISKYMIGGLYLGKNMFLRKSGGDWINRHSEFKNRGFSMVHLDEEGAVYWGEEAEWKRRLSRRLNINLIDDDFMCTWGNFQKSYYQDVIKDNDKKIITTGQPRFELLRKKYNTFFNDEVEEIKKKYGDFILVPTAFQWFNNAFGNADTFSQRSQMGYDVTNDVSRKRYIGSWNYSGKTFSDYVKMVTHISIKFPSINIILRPHPSEDIDFYNHAFSGVKNVHVVREKSVIPWILSTKLLIADSCTTSVEAYIAGTPVIIFQPNDDQEHDMFLPSLVGIKCRTIDDVISNVELISSGVIQKIPNPAENKRALGLLNNLNDTEDAFENVLSVLLNVENKGLDLPNKFNKVWFNIYRAKHKFLDNSKKTVRFLFKEKYRAYIANKNTFPGFNKNEISKKIRKIEEITNKKINYKFVNKNLIVMTQDD
jgi:surface carbohydrate biosynthesis protein